MFSINSKVLFLGEAAEREETDLSAASPRKRTFEFMENIVPSNFVANPDNHARWTRHNVLHKLESSLSGRSGRKGRNRLLALLGRGGIGSASSAAHPPNAGSLSHAS
jgi:hypothetical protein